MEQRVSWDELMRSILQGKSRHSFLTAVEEALESEQQSIRDALRRLNATEAFNRMIVVIKSIVLSHLSEATEKALQPAELTACKELHTELLRRRREIRAEAHELGLHKTLARDAPLEAQARACFALWKLQKDLRRNSAETWHAKQQHQKCIREYQTAQLNSAWRQRNLRQAWTEARRCTNTKVKRRWGHAGINSSPTNAQVFAQLEKVPGLGGWSAQQLFETTNADAAEVADKWIREEYGKIHALKQMISSEEVQKWEDAIYDMVMKQANHKFTPAHDLPMECYKLLMQPQFNACKMRPAMESQSKQEARNHKPLSEEDLCRIYGKGHSMLQKDKLFKDCSGSSDPWVYSYTKSKK